MNEFILHIEAGQISNLKKAREVFGGLRDGKYLVKIQPIKRRTLSQNAYYWKVVVPMVKDGLRAAGYFEIKSNEDAHEVLKHLFLKKKTIYETGGKPIKVPGSTAGLPTKAFNEYLEHITQWAVEYLNIQIPQPNEEIAIDEPITELK